MHKQKKKWVKPEIILIDQDNIKGGADHNYNEQIISKSTAGNYYGFEFRFKFNGGGSGLAHHPKNFYYS